MVYKLFTDKLNTFSCNIQLEGASLHNSKIRLIVESDEMTYMFNGQVFNDGICEVKIPKTKNFLSEGKKGLMRLEVIADDVYFEPWNSEFVVEQEKKVQVVVQEQIESKPKLVVSVNEQKATPQNETTVKEAIVKKPVNKSSNTTVISKAELLKKFKR